LKAADFIDVESHPAITFKGDQIVVFSKNEFGVTGDLTIRGVTQRATLDVNYLGQWGTPFWVDGEDQGPKTRAGFVATTSIDRNDFGMTWNGEMENGGVVVGNQVLITIDVEALLED
jgi:polyisoprenoid-binding protein YceI